MKTFQLRPSPGRCRLSSHSA